MALGVSAPGFAVFAPGFAVFAPGFAVSAPELGPVPGVAAAVGVAPGGGVALGVSAPGFAVSAPELGPDPGVADVADGWSCVPVVPVLSGPVPLNSFSACLTFLILLISLSGSRT